MGPIDYMLDSFQLNFFSNSLSDDIRLIAPHPPVTTDNPPEI